MNARYLLVTVLVVMSAAAQELSLLTGNGLGNEKYSEYKTAAQLETGGRYAVNPALASDKGASLTFSFAEGRFTNGDSSFSYKREPTPYSYWQGVGQGEAVFELPAAYRIERVRVCVLNSGPHGTERVELYKRGDPLEFPEALKLGELRAENGWNEFAELGTLADGVRLRFSAQAGKTYITVSEVEIWGRAAPAGTVSATPKRTGGKSIQEGNTEWYAFDFGPPNAPVFANFTGVSKDIVYTPERGYGFIPYEGGEPVTPSNFGPESRTVPGLGERDRAAGNASYVDSLYRDFMMTSEYYHTQVRQTFAIAVPNGTYRVMTFHGDQTYGRTGEQVWWIEAEGKRAVEKLDMPRNHTADAVFDATVTDGRLDLTLDAAAEDPARRGFLLNGVAVFPVDTMEEKAFADAKVRKIRAAVQRERDEFFASTFEEKPYVEDADMPVLSDADRTRGFVAFVPHWLATVYPNSVPRPADMTRALGCFACPGEYEPMTLALRSLRVLSRVSCAVGDLTGPGTIPSAAVEVRKVTCWPQRIGSSWGTEWQVLPELLEVKPHVDVPADTTQQFWLTIRVPPAAKPGVYRGVVTVAAANAGTAEIPMSVEVLPFTLAPNERAVGMYWYEHKVADTPLRDVQVRDMVEHGMTTLTMGRLFPEVSNRDGRAVLDVAALRTFLQEIRTLGIAGPIPYHTSGLMTTLKRAFPGQQDRDYDALYVEAIRQLEAVSARPDTPKLLYYAVDEIGRDDERGQKANHECALVANVPGATSYITVNNYAAGEKWGDTFDIWCGNIEYTAAQERALLAKGKRYMRYGPAYLNSARKARNSCGFGFYRRPAEAMFYWHYQCYQGDPYDDFDGTCRDHCAVYPGPDGEQVPTIDWESLREGVDDMKYIATLKQYAARVANRPGGTAAATQALAVLEDVLGGDDRVNKYTFRDDLSDDEYHALRRKLVDAILALRQVAD